MWWDFKQTFCWKFTTESASEKKFENRLNIRESYGQESSVLFFDSRCISDHIVSQVICQRPQGLKSKGKVFPYSLPSVGPGADPGVQAVSPQVA